MLFFLASLIILIFSHSVNGKDSDLPPLKIHPLPLSLQNWISDNQEDYFSQIEPHLAGYLIWSNFPVKVYLQSPDTNLSPAGLTEFEQWQKAVTMAITVWNPYLPLIEVDSPEKADILIYRRYPEFKAEINPKTGLYNLPRAKAATTTVKFYVTETNPPQLRHRMTIEVNPHQTFDYLVTNITHELGHALGIWGHSLNETDIMYYSHTKQIPTISPQDINTLKKIYQQPTRLGWQQ
ncbi:matrixin family metalloprotease [Geminocystis sp. GBBB08]|uniref:matrixin family metalloprotease n=1 Tax=Geminocystis sp. GBBB08 TaxID=2604140 RepID=UPI0027E32739|nr:matrixin family metalloprotease [Geminocystis sp. GBBB08]